MIDEIESMIVLDNQNDSELYQTLWKIKKFKFDKHFHGD